MKKWFVSRQDYYGEDEETRYCVEIAAGGIDYSNPDMLCEKYPKLGEGEEFRDPREAVQAALAVAKAWAADRPGLVINVAHGDTMGGFMPFEGEEAEELIAWAERQYEKLEKCPACGTIVEGAREWYYTGVWYGSEFDVHPDSGKYCSEWCASMHSSAACTECGEIFSDHIILKEGYNPDGILCPKCYADYLAAEQD